MSRNGKQLKASQKWKENFEFYTAPENLKKLYLVYRMEPGRTVQRFVLAKNNRQAKAKARDLDNSGVVFNVPYLVPYTLEDYRAVAVTKIEEILRSELAKGEGCGIS